MIEVRFLQISDLEYNKGQVEGLPKNSRFVRDVKFEAMKKSIIDAPDMLELRELIVFPHDGKFVTVCGNLRLRACKELKYEEVPCKVLPEDTPPAKLREYASKDNVSFGENDMDILANEWDRTELEGWGFHKPEECDQ